MAVEGQPSTHLMCCWEKAGAMLFRTRRHCGDLLLCVSRLGSLARLLICSPQAIVWILGLLRQCATLNPTVLKPYHADGKVALCKSLAVKRLV